jgi:hypothetical protein
MNIFLAYLMYKLIAAEMALHSLPMIIVMFTCLLWIIAPIIFCPQPTPQTFQRDLKDFFTFIIENDVSRPESNVAKPLEKLLHVGLKDKKANLYDFWLKRALEHKILSKKVRFAIMLKNIMKLFLVVSICYGSMLDHFWNVFILWAIHCIVMEVSQNVAKKMITQLLSILMWVVVPPIVWPEIPYVHLLTVYIVLIVWLGAMESFILYFAWIIYGCDRPEPYEKARPKREEEEGKAKNELSRVRPRYEWEQYSEKTKEDRKSKKSAYRQIEKYDHLVERLYVDFLGHQLHLYCALFVLLCFFFTQLMCLLLESFWGMHSVLLLNARLVGKGCGRKRGYVPGKDKESSVSEAVYNAFKRHDPGTQELAEVRAKS